MKGLQCNFSKNFINNNLKYIFFTKFMYKFICGRSDSQSTFSYTRLSLCHKTSVINKWFRCILNSWTPEPGGQVLHMQSGDLLKLISIGFVGYLNAIKYMDTKWPFQAWTLHNLDFSNAGRHISFSSRLVLIISGRS